MRKIFEQLKAALAEFLKQRDDLLLLVCCEDAEVALLLQALRDLDRQSASDLFFLFAEEFESPEQFLSGIANRLEEEQRLTNECADTEAARLPPLPAEFLTASTHPVARLEAGLSYAHSLIDIRNGQHYLWGMGPASIGDESSYLALLSALLRHPTIQPWMRGARIVARVPAHFQREASQFSSAHRVRVTRLHIPPNVQEDELLATAEDPKAPAGDRMQAEMQLAYLDYAHSRFDSAIARFLKTLAFYQWAGIPALESLAICGLGDVALRQGDWPIAQHWYECAVVPAAKSGNPTLMATLVSKLGAVAFMENRFSDAEERYGELATLKRAMIDEDGLVEALEWQGLSQEKQQAYDRALVSWEEGALLCKAFDMKGRFPDLVGHLRRGYQALGMREELDTFDSEWVLEG